MKTYLLTYVTCVQFIYYKFFALYTQSRCTEDHCLSQLGLLNYR